MNITATALAILLMFSVLPLVYIVITIIRLFWAMSQEVAEENYKIAGEDMSKLSRYDRFVLRRVLQENERWQHE